MWKQSVLRKDNMLRPLSLGVPNSPNLEKFRLVFSRAALIAAPLQPNSDGWKRILWVRCAPGLMSHTCIGRPKFTLIRKNRMLSRLPMLPYSERPLLHRTVPKPRGATAVSAGGSIRPALRQ